MGWALILLLLIHYLTSRKAKPLPLPNDPVLLKSIQQLYSTWHPPTLKFLFNREIQKFPHYEPFLTEAYARQLKLLDNFEKGEEEAINHIKTLLMDRIAQCQSQQMLDSLRNQFSLLVAKIPEWEALFHLPRLKFNSNSKRSSKNLFEHCLTVEEVKKRFRRLAFLNHPDKGGCDKAMREIVRQYECALLHTKPFSKKSQSK